MADPKAIHGLGLFLNHLLDDLENVEISTPLNDQVLTYESVTSKWKNKTPSGGGGLPSIDSGCRVNRTTDQSIPGSTWTKVDFTDEEWDIDNEFDLVNDKFVVKTAGYYSFAMYLRMLSMPANYVVLLDFKKNGSAIVRQKFKFSSATDIHVVLSWLEKCAVDDYFEVWVYQNYSTRILSSAKFTCMRVLAL